MKLRFLSAVSLLVLLSASVFASSGPDWDRDDRDRDREHHHHHRYATPEADVISMIVLSLGTIGGGLVLKHRRSNRLGSIA
jgi:hypothetical protein